MISANVFGRVYISTHIYYIFYVLLYLAFGLGTCSFAQIQDQFLVFLLLRFGIFVKIIFVRDELSIRTFHTEGVIGNFPSCYFLWVIFSVFL